MPVDPVHPVHVTRAALAVDLGDELAEQLLGVALEPLPSEPVADVHAVAVQQVEALRVRHDVDDLRQVDRDDPAVVHEQVVRREVAVREARGARVRMKSATWWNSSRSSSGVARTWASRGAATRPSPMNSMSTSVSLTCTGYGTEAPSSVSRLRASNSAYAHCTRAIARPNDVPLARARTSRVRRVPRPSV